MSQPTEHVPRRRSHTRARLLQAAGEVFAEKGLQGATVDDLVGAAGFSRGAFYSNFSSLEEVFCELFEQESTQTFNTARAVIDSIPEGEFGFDSIGLILDSLRPHGRRWYLIHTEFTLYALRRPDMAEALVRHSQRWFTDLAELITEALRRLGRVPTVPASQLVRVIFSLHLDSLAQEHLGIWPDGPERVIEEVVPVVVTSFSTAVPGSDIPGETDPA